MPDTNRIPAITPRSVTLAEGAAIPFEAKRLACEILRSYRSAALSTLDPGGFPYGSVTDIATDHDGTPIFILAGLALHTRNIAADNRISLVLANLGEGDALAKPRLTLVGRSEQARPEDVERLSFRFLKRHPKGKVFLALPDVRIHYLRTEAVQLSAGPGRNAAEVKPGDLVTDIAGAEALLAREPEILERLDADAGSVARIAEIAGFKPGRWRVTGIDPEGLDLAMAGEVARLWFSGRVVSEEALERELAVLRMKPGE